VGSPPLIPEIRLHLAGDAIELWERTEQDASHAQLPPPFWAFPWAGGQALARYLLDQPTIVRDRAVLDLAAGSGLVALAAARAGAATVTPTETDPLAITAIGLNSAANGIRLTAALGDVLDGEAPATDVVLAGDVFYERALAGRLLGFLDRAHAAGAVVLVGDPGRAYLPRDRFEPVATYQVPVPRTLEDADVKQTMVWQLR
jgi:predicted nicotinamide N-methyase